MTRTTRSQARPARTYRAARRNFVLRGEKKQVWSAMWYVPQHQAAIDKRQGKK